MNSINMPSSKYFDCNENSYHIVLTAAKASMDAKHLFLITTKGEDMIDRQEEFATSTGPMQVL